MKYNQFVAMWAITKASFRSITRNPSAVIFSFVFPFIFILVFGFIGKNGAKQTFKIVIDKASDTSNIVYKTLTQMDGLKIINFPDEATKQADLNKGRFAGIVKIEKSEVNAKQPYQLTFKTTSSSNDQWPQVKSMLDDMLNKISDKMYADRNKYASFEFNPVRDVAQVREFKTIDFILPGQLGFSLLSAGVFGVAFMFYNLRNTMVLKRFFATPIQRSYIILGEGLSRVIFQLITAVVIILVGYFAFGFTLINGVETFLNMMVLSFFGLVVFMGFGFVVSGVATSDSTIPPFANLITLPQFLLGGTFFSIDNFPKWLQPISQALPLTHINAAMRKIAFEGQSLWDVKFEIGILMIWGIIVYALAVKLFRWE
jgi:ABC-2 type transport system permease protein